MTSVAIRRSIMIFFVALTALMAGSLLNPEWARIVWGSVFLLMAVGVLAVDVLCIVSAWRGEAIALPGRVYTGARSVKRSHRPVSFWLTTLFNVVFLTIVGLGMLGGALHVLTH